MDFPIIGLKGPQLYCFLYCIQFKIKLFQLSYCIPLHSIIFFRTYIQHKFPFPFATVYTLGFPKAIPKIKANIWLTLCKEFIKILSGCSFQKRRLGYTRIVGKFYIILYFVTTCYSYSIYGTYKRIILFCLWCIQIQISDTQLQNPTGCSRYFFANYEFLQNMSIPIY